MTVAGWKSDPDLPIGDWVGRVKSDANKCQKARDVELYLVQGKEPVMVGDATTTKAGQRWIWKIGTGGPPADGKYFALAPPTAGCARAESKIFRYPQDN